LLFIKTVLAEILRQAHLLRPNEEDKAVLKDLPSSACNHPTSGLYNSLRKREKVDSGKRGGDAPNRIRNRGTQDILTARMDELSGLPDAVRAVFPRTRAQQHRR
jgi:hypothetical protein